MRATLVFLHGLGDSGRGWLSAMQQIAGAIPGLQILLPDAPVQPVTINGGMRMPSWYDIVDFGEQSHDHRGMEKSCREIEKLMEGRPEPIFVGGFSQGAVIALLTALHCPRVWAAVCLSGYFPRCEENARIAPREGHRLAIWMGHGTQDETVRFKWGHQSYLELSKMLDDGQIEFKSYSGMGHSACEQELDDIAGFLSNAMAQLSKTKSEL